MATSRYLRLHPLLRVLIYLAGNFIIIFLLQIITNGFLPSDGIGFNILMPLTVLLFTWWILRLEGRKPDDIGCLPNKKSDAKDYVVGIFIGIWMMASTAIIIKSFTGFRWELNPDFRPWSLVTLLVIAAGSVYAQELAFRGYPFQLLLDKYGVWPAQIIIAILFGCMHLMERSMSFSDALLLIFTTGIGSVFYGMAYIKTRRLALPVALHLGWNYCQYLLPRHPVQNGPGIWIIEPASLDQTKFSFLTWTIPYLIVVILFYAAVNFIYRQRRNTK